MAYNGYCQIIIMNYRNLKNDDYSIVGFEIFSIKSN